MIKLNAAQINLIKEMGVNRIQADSDFFNGENGAILNELITIGIVEKVRGRQGWAAWQVVNFYDLMDEIENTPAQIVETPTEIETTWPRCAKCNQMLQATETVHCEDCVIKMNPANSPEARIARGAMAYRLFTPASSFAGLHAHADVLGLDRDGFEDEYIKAGGIIYFDETTDAAPAIDPRDARIAELEARIAVLEAKLAALCAKAETASDADDEDEYADESEFDQDLENPRDPLAATRFLIRHNFGQRD